MRSPKCWAKAPWKEDAAIWNLLRERAEATENVFSVIDSLGKEKVWYLVFGNDLTDALVHERRARCPPENHQGDMAHDRGISAGLTMGLSTVGRHRHDHECMWPKALFPIR